MTRTEASTAIAKVFAYIACGHYDKARLHAQPLIAWLSSL